MTHNYHYKLVFLTTMALLLLSISGSSLFPYFTKFHLCMINGFPSTAVTISCRKSLHPADDSHKGMHNTSNDGTFTVQGQGSYNWSFHGHVGLKLEYDCDARWGNDEGIIRNFQAFLVEKNFLDYNCGGRHCIWRYNVTGAYLYHLQLNEYRFRYAWTPLASNSKIG